MEKLQELNKESLYTSVVYWMVAPGPHYKSMPNPWIPVILAYLERGFLQVWLS